MRVAPIARASTQQDYKNNPQPWTQNPNRKPKPSKTRSKARDLSHSTQPPNTSQSSPSTPTSFSRVEPKSLWFSEAPMSGSQFRISSTRSLYSNLREDGCLCIFSLHSPAGLLELTMHTQTACILQSCRPLQFREYNSPILARRGGAGGGAGGRGGRGGGGGVGEWLKRQH